MPYIATYKIMSSGRKASGDKNQYVRIVVWNTNAWVNEQSHKREFAVATLLKKEEKTV
jgi:hypothetical protein